MMTRLEEKSRVSTGLGTPFLLLFTVHSPIPESLLLITVPSLFAYYPAGSVLLTLRNTFAVDAR